MIAAAAAAPTLYGRKPMLDVTLNWTPNPDTLAKLLALSNQQQKSLETLLDEAVLQYCRLQASAPLKVDDDPIVGFYSGTADLAENAETILAAEVQPRSGRTHKA